MSGKRKNSFCYDSESHWSCVVHVIFQMFQLASDIEIRCCPTLDVYLLFAIWMGPMQSKIIYKFVTYGLNSL